MLSEISHMNSFRTAASRNFFKSWNPSEAACRFGTPTPKTEALFEHFQNDEHPNLLQNSEKNLRSEII